jgi:hypothetical protein
MHQHPQGVDLHQQVQVLQQQLGQQLSVQQMATMQAPNASGIQFLLQFANASVEQMKERGIPDVVIVNVERCRPLLMRHLLKLSQEQQGKAGVQPPPGPANGSRTPNGQQPLLEDDVHQLTQLLQQMPLIRSDSVEDSDAQDMEA